MQDKNKKKIKSTYRPIKDHNNKSGNDKKTSQFYEQLDAILGHRPASTPPVVLDACAGGLSALPEEREDSDSELGKVPNHNITAHTCSHIIFLKSLSEETTTETTTEDTTPVDVQGVQ